VERLKASPVAGIVVVLAVSLSGCGTVCNLAGGIVHPDSEPRIYGGVVRDLEIIDKAVSGPPATESIGDAKFAALILAVAVADPFLSFVGDTLTLPLTVPLQERRQTAERAEDKAGAAAGKVAAGDARQPPQAE
jgi:uncharacterized protein YceK